MSNLNQCDLTGSCDCHLHVIGPKSRYPLANRRVYTPMDAPLGNLLNMHKILGIERMVLVQTSIFGYDNSCLLDALKSIGPRARGVAVLEPNTPDEYLDELNKIGVRGLRINLATYGFSKIDKIIEQLNDSARMCMRNNWHLQIFTTAAIISALAPSLQNLPVPVVVDHFALLEPKSDICQNEIAIKQLLENGTLWLKISAPYRLDHTKTNDFSNPEIRNLTRRLYRYNPNRIIWGTDWPHPPIHSSTIGENKEVPYRDIDTAGLLEELYRCFGDTKDLRQILVKNPSVLYGFD